MKKPKTYEYYPILSVISVIIFYIAVYAFGAYVMFRLHLASGIIYLIYLLMLEFHVYKDACPHCYYYGKLCFSGRGRLAKLLYKKGEAKKFCEREFNFKDFLPQLVAVLVPVIVGIALLVSRGFHILTLIATLYPVFNWIVINPLIFGKLGCPHCKQGKICCPALDFFGQKSNKKK
ncbi:MAG: hypothetical protein KKF44_09850 [Nanoarchaeota archaeon]|nr:hypothetical protein [Nanoarchaeota archaeon]